jgi:hypothetical protein
MCVTALNCADRTCFGSSPKAESTYPLEALPISELPQSTFSQHLIQALQSYTACKQQQTGYVKGQCDVTFIEKRTFLGLGVEQKALPFVTAQ